MSYKTHAAKSAENKQEDALQMCDYSTIHVTRLRRDAVAPRYKARLCAAE